MDIPLYKRFDAILLKAYDDIKQDQMKPKKSLTHMKKSVEILSNMHMHTVYKFDSIL